MLFLIGITSAALAYMGANESSVSSSLVPSGRRAVEMTLLPLILP